MGELLFCFLMAKGISIWPILLLAGGGGYLGYNYLKQHGLAVAAQETRNLKIRIEGIHADQHEVSMDVNIQNPNTSNFDIQSFVGSMQVDGRKVGDVQMFGDYNVKGNSQMTLPLVVVPNISIYQQAMKGMIRGKSRISFSGTINVNNHAIPLSISYTV